MNDNELPYYECVINLTLYPVRQARNQEEFIENLIAEYNAKAGDLVTLSRSDLTNITPDEEDD